jgi:NADH-quinone oxidoreductase subunit L
MLGLLWLIPVLPFISFLVLVLIGPRLSRTGVAIIGVGSLGLSALVSLLVGFSFMSSPPPDDAFSQTLWTWMDVAGFTPGITFHLDALSLIMMLVVTVVGFLIHLYSVEYMIDEEGYSRFFAYMNLFVVSMLTLVLADNLLLLYLGWEGVGLCSYLLIGFWYKDPANGLAARKAFTVTRVGDTAMALGLFLLFARLGTLNIHGEQGILELAKAQWPVGSGLAVAAAAMLLGGALGKSGQLPLQTWLPDAMAGPTPVSALIHAATMVTAGVYLIARTYVLFELAPSVQFAVAVIGAVTLLVAGCSALTQRDMKRILAYSTISQIGYMFLALGVGAWSAAMFHFMTHAFFKALLFLGAGAVILALHHEQDIFKMGGLWRELPVTSRTFVIGAAALAGFPFITAGFYSKDLILWKVWSDHQPWLYVVGLVGALLTAIYSFRLVFIAFFGEAKGHVDKKPGVPIKIPLIVLAALAIIGGFVELPHAWGNWQPFGKFMETAFKLTASSEHAGHGEASAELGLQGIAVVASVVGIFLAYLFFLRNRASAEGIARSSLGSVLHRFWFAGWGFDWLYDKVFVRPFVWAARINKSDFIDFIYRLVAGIIQVFHFILSLTQTGRVRWYAVGIAVGAVIIVGFVLFI